MRKRIASVMAVAVAMVLLLSAGAFAPEKATAASRGWHLVDTQYHPASYDVTVYGGAVPRGGGLFDTYTGEGSEKNMRFSHSRKDSSGKGVAHVSYQVIWDAPPAYLAPNQKTGFNMEMKELGKSNSWGPPSIGASFDMGDIKPGYATAGGISFITNSGETRIKGNVKAYFESSKVIPEGRAGDKKAIVLYLGFGDSPTGYTYVYEWKEAAAPSTLVQNGSYDLKGKWSIMANRSSGTFEITNQSGNTFSGTVHLDAGKTEKLTNGKITGNTLTFTRMWDSGSLRQDYTGTLSVDAKGIASVSGTFSQNGAGSYTWSATKATSMSLPVTPAPTTPTAPSTPATPAGSGAEAFESGSRIMWQPASGLGYRLFRSTSSTSLGISVTDFYITSTSFADVNVQSNTTYYYTVKPVLAEARPFEGIEEKLGPTIATFTVKTSSQVYKPGSFKHFILMKLGSPYMSIDGVNQEIDPGRGTQPLIMSGRTMVPIRAVVEAMGGTVTWDAGTQKITLNARGNQVEMWLNKTDIKINGTAKKMDVPPVSQQDRTFVPLRFAAENLNCKVDWINSTKEAVTVYED